MDVFLVFFLAAVCLWLISRNRSGADRRFEETNRELDRLRQRVAVLESQAVSRESPAQQTAPEARPQAAADLVPSVHRGAQREAAKPAPLPYAPLSVPAPLQAQSTQQREQKPIEARTPAPPPGSLWPAAQQPSAPAPPGFAAQHAPAGNTPPAAPPTFAEPPSRPFSLEERLGQNWLNKLGIVTLVTGLTLFLGYQARTLGPLGKSLLGLALALGILAAGLVLERRERYRLFARAAIGGGWALLYFVTFALYHLPAMQVLHSQGVDLVLMLLVAAAMVLHSLRYRSQVITSLAFLLAFFTVSISHVTLFSLVAGVILAAGLIAVAFRQRWFALALAGLLSSYLNHFLWLQRVLPGGGQPGHPFPEFLPSAALLLFDWLLFRLFYIFRKPETGAERICAGLNVVLNTAGLLGLLKFQSSHPEWAFAGLLTLGVAELVLAFVARRQHHTAFVTLACIASLLLLAAVPFRFSGANWSLVWLLQAELLFVAGLALRETVFRRLGLLSSFAAAIHLIVAGALPVFMARQGAPDTSHHFVLVVAFATAAVFFWLNAEWLGRRWPFLAEASLDRSALNALSYAAALCAAVALWLAIPGAWTLAVWLGLALALGFISGKLRSAHLAQQCDTLAFTALARAAYINFYGWSHDPHDPRAPRVLIVLLATAVLYALMQRKQPSILLYDSDIPMGYSWSAAGMLALLAWYALQPAAVALAWALLGLVLLELGLVFARRYFRQQAAALLAAAFVRLFFVNIGLAPTPRLWTMLPLAAIFAWSYQRLFSAREAQTSQTSFDRFTSTAAAWFALATVSTLLYFQVRPAWVAAAGAALSFALLLLAWLLRRSLFTAQAFTMVCLTLGRALAWNMLSPTPLGASFTEGRTYSIGLVCVLLLAALPIAFQVRRQQSIAQHASPLAHLVLARPEQIFFFAPLALLTVFLAVELRAGMITVGWSALGLITFLVALMLGERSFRLAGLGLLMLGVGKIIAVDIWHASPTDRYITLIVMGAVLLSVSFLYSRYRETILKLL